MSRQLSAAYRAGWNASAKIDGPRLDEAEDRYAKGHSAAQQDAWSAGWIDYASDYAYGTALAEITQDNDAARIEYQLAP
jgi:hypothetical protein